MSVSRRNFVRAAIGTGIAAPSLVTAGTQQSKPEGQFLHGVASGDPLQDRVIIWTRVSTSAASAEVSWQFSVTPNFEQLIASGTLLTDASRDYTVKVDVTGLSSDTHYYYLFMCDGQVSMTGRTRTLPAGKPEEFALAVVSCSNLPQGYFNVYRAVANRDDVDVVLHLGDYIYEYANGEYGDGTALGRLPRPLTECLQLDDYRQRYACYREDEDLMAVHARHPFILVWDDHEFANNAWLKGAENHSDDEGAWPARRDAAIQAYFEWLPIRETVSDRQRRIYRSFQVGDLFDLIMLDTRMIGRTEQIDTELGEDLARPGQDLLGTQQAHWLRGELDASAQSNTLWRVLGQQVIMAQVFNAEGQVLNTDFWDGYPASRQQLLAQLRQHSIGNNVILTGDAHSSWASDIAENPFDPENYNSTSGEGALAVEFVTPAVSSPPPVSPPEKAEQLAQSLRMTHPHIKYLDLSLRGYMVLRINRQYITNSWYHIESVAIRSAKEQLTKQYRVDLNKPGLTEVS